MASAAMTSLRQEWPMINIHSPCFRTLGKQTRRWTNQLGSVYESRNVVFHIPVSADDLVHQRWGACPRHPEKASTDEVFQNIR